MGHWTVCSPTCFTKSVAICSACTVESSSERADRPPLRTNAVNSFHFRWTMRTASFFTVRWFFRSAATALHPEAQKGRQSWWRASPGFEPRRHIWALFLSIHSQSRCGGGGDDDDGGGRCLVPQQSVSLTCTKPNWFGCEACVRGLAQARYTFGSFENFERFGSSYALAWCHGKPVLQGTRCDHHSHTTDGIKVPVVLGYFGLS